MANRYWVTGGDGNWNSTTNWSTASNGASGASVPSTSDAAIFDASSGSGIATLDISPTIQTLTCTGFTGTLAFGTNNISLNSTGTIFTGATTMTVTGTPVINCTNATATTRTINPQAVTEANSISFNITAGTGAIGIGGSGQGVKNLNFTGFSGSWSAVNLTSYGNVILSSGMSITAGGTLTIGSAAATQQFTSNGVNFDRGIVITGTACTFQLQDSLTIGSTRTVTLTNGALDLNNNTLSCGFFNSNNTNTRSIAFGTGNITLTGSGTTIWNVSNFAGLTTSGTPVVNCTYAGSTGTRTIANTSGIVEPYQISFNISAGSDTIVATSGFKDLDFTGFTGTLSNDTRIIYGNLTVSSGMTLSAGSLATTFRATSGTKTITTNGKTLDFPIGLNGVGGTFAFADALTQGSTQAFTITAGTVKLKAGATSTVGAFATSGSNQKYLQSTIAGSQATLSQASGTVTVSYLSIKDIAATGGATWNAYVDYNNVDQGDNTGWDFSYSPAIDNEFPVTLRSFTQPKRF